jgi:hypothetical protein
VTGTIPFTGIALPFISVGGSSLVTCMVGIGIMLSVSRVANAEPSEFPVRDSRAVSSPRRASNLEPGTLR